MKCGALGGFAVTGGALLAFSTMYTLTSLGRSDSRTTFRGYACGGGKSGTSSSPLFRSSLELSDTKDCEPYIRARHGVPSLQTSCFTNTPSFWLTDYSSVDIVGGRGYG